MQKGNNQLANAAPKWLIIIASLLVIWNLLGVMAFIMQMTMTAEQIAMLPDNEQLLYQNMPTWVTLAFACAVFGGTLGCIALVLRKTIALPILVISLLGVLVQMTYTIFISNSIEVYGPGGMVMPILVFVIALYLVWQAHKAKVKGWLS
ncbi:hypothetical protein [Paraglaciecola aestuariivivens]